jgi:hypothetical protein
MRLIISAEFRIGIEKAGLEEEFRISGDSECLNFIFPWQNPRF